MAGTASFAGVGRETYRRYAEGKTWRCGDSPTGAHYWVDVEGSHGLFRCKHCNDVRKFPVSLDAAIRATYRLSKGLEDNDET